MSVFAEFAIKASKNGIRIKSNAKEYGGFENFHGDFNKLMETLDGLIEAKARHSINKKFILSYDYIKNDAGRVDVETFANTNGRNITLN